MAKSGSRTSLLDSCYALMLARGYAATGVDEICRHAGVSKGSFYHFFPTKQQCALEMLDHHMAEAQATIEEGLDLANLRLDDVSIAYVEHVERLSEKVFQNGCLIGAFALELAESHPEVREQVSRIFRGTAYHFEKVLTPLAKASRQKNVPTPQQLAEQMLTVIEGGVVLSKAHGDTKYLSQGLRLFRHYLESLRPARKTNRSVRRKSVRTIPKA
jgi:TetR/AcrR family transcriptional repressor of nem operon